MGGEGADDGLGQPDPYGEVCRRGAYGDVPPHLPDRPVLRVDPCGIEGQIGGPTRGSGQSAASRSAAAIIAY